MEIRDAVPEDAPAGCAVMSRSIAELCVADHKNDPAILARWLGNKTVENVVDWIRQPDNSLMVAVEKAFGVRFRVGEVEATKNVGEFADLIARRIAEK